MNLPALCKHVCPLLRLAASPPALARLSAVRDYSDRRGGRISETSVFIQTGHRITELPVVVKKVNDVWELYRKMGIDTTVKQPEDQHLVALPKELNEEEKEIISGFNRCYNSSSIFRLLETIPINEVTPPVAAKAYKKIVELENNLEARDPSKAGMGGDDQPRSFFRSAFNSHFLLIICSGKNPTAILGGLTIIQMARTCTRTSCWRSCWCA